MTETTNELPTAGSMAELCSDNWRDKLPDTVEVLGEQSNSFDALMVRDFTFLYLQNSYARSWLEFTIPFAEFVAGKKIRYNKNRTEIDNVIAFDGTKTITPKGDYRAVIQGLKHDIRDKKDGSGFIPRMAKDGLRDDNKMTAATGICLDIDGGNRLEEVLEAVEGCGKAAIVWTSHNHAYNGYELPFSKLGGDYTSTNPTLAEVQAYFRKQGKDESWLNQLEIHTPRHGPHEDPVIRLRVAPVHKVRVVFPFAEPMPLDASGKKLFANIVAGWADELGLDVDPCSFKVNQIMYLPSVPKGFSSFARSYVVQGEPLCVADIKPIDSKTSSKAPFDIGGDNGDVTAKPTGVYMTPDGLDLVKWDREYKSYFPIADYLTNTTNGTDKVAIDCPFCDGGSVIDGVDHAPHSDGRRGGAWMRNPDPDASGPESLWMAACSHSHTPDRLEYILAMLESGDLVESDLTDFESWGLDDKTFAQLTAKGELCDQATDEASYTPPLPLSAPLYDPELVANGLCKKKHADKLRSQIKTNLRSRISHVIVEGGKSKVFVSPPRGQMPDIWDDTALAKLFRNKSVRYKNGDTYSEIKPADVFWNDDERVTYTGTQFEPDLTKADPHKFNTFNGFPIEPRKGDWSLLKNHIKDNICAGNGSEKFSDEYLFYYFMMWCADLLQNPSRKFGSSIAVLGEQGVGKSKFWDWLRKALGAYATKVASKKHLVGNFNSHLDSKLLVVAEEAFWSGDKEAASILKDFITSETYTVERKGIDATERKNYIRTAFITNNDWAIPTDDNADARRFLVLRANTKQKQNAAYFKAIDAQMNNGGLEAMVFDLMHWDPTSHGMTWDDLRQAPWTPARAEQATQGASFAMTALLQAIEDGMFPDRDGIDVPLSDTKTTRVNRTDLAAFMRGKAAHGGASKAVSKAVKQLLGEEAWHETPYRFDNGTYARYVDIPPLNDLRKKITYTFQ